MEYFIPPIKAARTHSSFIKQISPVINKNKYYTACTGKEGIWLCRLRLGLSALNFHRYTYQLINNPFCPHCPNTQETNSHYFFVCPSYSIARQTLLNELRDIGIDTTNKTQLLTVILHGSSNTSIAEILPIIFNYLKISNRFK